MHHLCAFSVITWKKAWQVKLNWSRSCFRGWAQYSNLCKKLCTLNNKEWNFPFFYDELETYHTYVATWFRFIFCFASPSPKRKLHKVIGTRCDYCSITINNGRFIDLISFFTSLLDFILLKSIQIDTRKLHTEKNVRQCGLFSVTGQYRPKKKKSRVLSLE